MLTIRKEQYVALESYMLERFRDTLLRNLRADLPQETGPKSDEELRRLIQSGIERARRYGITSAHDVSLFIYLMVWHSPTFEEAPDMRWARKILVKPNMTPEGKLKLIYQMLSARQQPGG